MATTAVESHVMPSETWPTGDDYTRALALLAAAAHAVDALHGRLYRLVSDAAPSLREGQPAPDARDIGNLAVFVTHAELDIRGMADDVKDAEERLRNITLDNDYIESSVSRRELIDLALGDWKDDD